MIRPWTRALLYLFLSGTHTMATVQTGIPSFAWFTETIQHYENWYQVAVNEYVSTTTEVDWNCTHVHIHNTSPDSFTITKNTKLHTTLPHNQTWIWNSCRYQMDTDSIECHSTDSAVDYTIRNVWVHPLKELSLVITKNDNFTLWVWTTSVDSFGTWAKPLIDVQVQKWGYTGKYKAPQYPSWSTCTDP